MLGHNRIWEYGYSLFLTAIKEAEKRFKKT
jgi:hypothetical protein